MMVPNPVMQDKLISVRRPLKEDTAGKECMRAMQHHGEEKVNG